MREAPLALLVLTLPLLAGCLAPAPEPLAAAGSPAGPGPAGATQYPVVGEGKARIHRDAFGVPHVYADTEEALFFAQGYAQAEDRLFQMELFRMAGKGRLAELLGPEALPLDRWLRLRVGTEQDRWDVFHALDPRDQAAFEAFVAGINAAAARALRDPALFPVEFAGLVDPIKPWSVTDSIAVATLLEGVFGEFGGQELANALLLADLEARLGEPAAWAILADVAWVADPGSPPTIPPEDLAYPLPDLPAALPAAQRALLTPAVLEAARGAEDRRHDFAAAALALGFPSSWGSNALALSGRVAAHGAPILVGGPQTGYSVPAVFWEGGLHGAGFDVVGVVPPGIPGIAIGRTARAAWSVTSGFGDQVDVFVEELHPQDPTRYQAGGAWVPMDHRIETYLVASPGGAPSVVVEDVWETRHGPVVAITADGRHALARAAAHRGLEVTTGVCWLRLGQMHGLDDLTRCAGTIATSFNFLYADDEGHIAYYHTGRVPVRAAGFDPRFPLPGEGADWQGFEPPARLPHVVDPQQGWLANWNNLPARGWPAGDQREVWGLVNRAGGLQRWVQAHLDAHGSLDGAMVEQAIREAATSGLFAPLFAGHVAAAPPGPAREAILAWVAAGAPIADADGDGAVDDPGVGAYQAFHAALAEQVLADELGPWLRAPWYPEEIPGNEDTDSHGSRVNSDTELLRALDGTARWDWADDLRTPARETAALQVARALAAAEPALGAPLPMPRSVFQAFGAGSMEPIPRMNRGSFNQVVELVPGGVHSRTALPPGQSGLLSATMAAGLDANPHLDDQRALYAGWGFKRTPFTVGEVEAAAERSYDVVVSEAIPFPSEVPAPVRQALGDAGVPAVSVLGELSTGP